jgi:hypothetical protein
MGKKGAQQPPLTKNAILSRVMRNKQQHSSSGKQLRQAAAGSSSSKQQQQQQAEAAQDQSPHANAHKPHLPPPPHIRPFKQNHMIVAQQPTPISVCLCVYLHNAAQSPS